MTIIKRNTSQIFLKNKTVLCGCWRIQSEEWEVAPFPKARGPRAHVARTSGIKLQAGKQSTQGAGRCRELTWSPPHLFPFPQGFRAESPGVFREEVRKLLSRGTGEKGYDENSRPSVTGRLALCSHFVTTFLWSRGQGFGCRASWGGKRGCRRGEKCYVNSAPCFLVHIWG